MAEAAAYYALDQGQKRVGAVTMKYGQVKGAQRARLAANRVGLGDGSAAELQASTDLMKEIDALTISADATANPSATRRRDRRRITGHRLRCGSHDAPRCRRRNQPVRRLGLDHRRKCWDRRLVLVRDGQEGFAQGFDVPAFQGVTDARVPTVDGPMTTPGGGYPTDFGARVAMPMPTASGITGRQAMDMGQAMLQSGRQFGAIALDMQRRSMRRRPRVRQPVRRSPARHPARPGGRLPERHRERCRVWPAEGGQSHPGHAQEIEDGITMPGQKSLWGPVADRRMQAAPDADR